MKTSAPSNVFEITLPPQSQSDRLINYPDVTFEGKPINTFDNLAFLVNSLGLQPAQNQMNLELEILKENTPLNQSFEAKRSLLISEAAKTRLPKAAIEDHMTALCESNLYHPVKAWLSGQWDGVERVNKVIDTLNAKRPELAKIAMSNWLIAAIAALYEDNFSCKIVPILQGGQSFKKTTFISRIAKVIPHAFVEGAELNPDSKDSILKVIKAWIVELGELERTSRNSQGSLKAFITQEIDSIRPPYARSDIKKKRQTVFIASVNGSDFLRDETGSSRYCVIELEQAIDIDSLNTLLGWTYENGRLTHSEPELLRQFWLEVKARYDAGGSWILSEEELQLFNIENKTHQFKDDIRTLLEDKIADTPDTTQKRWMKASEVCEYLRLPPTKSRQVGRALKAMSEDNLIEHKNGRSNSNLYYMPTSIIHFQ